MAEVSYVPHLPGYRIKGEISRSGASVVYLADDLLLARRVVVKVPHPSVDAGDPMHDRFLRECRLAAGLTHPNLLPVYAGGYVHGRPYAVLPYVAGGTLRTVLDGHGRLTLARTVRLVAQLAAGLDHLHARGVVHRDVKPDNVLVDARVDVHADVPADRREHWYLADFGVAGRAGWRDPGPGVGSAGYGAPEQLAGRPVDRRADVYALGAIVLSCLTGRVLTGAADGEPARLPAAVARVVATAMAADPRDRYASCVELAAAIRSRIAVTEVL